MIDPIFDEKLKCDADYFEVSSPGLTRPLEDISDYKRYEGELIDVKLFTAEKLGTKSFTGKILEAKDTTVIFEKEDGTGAELELTDISKAVRHIVF